MKKIVSSGEQDCTVNLDGTECAVVFSSNYKCFTVQNDTAEDIYISISPNIAAGNDGVRRVISGASSSLAHGRNNVDTLYILGIGSVQVTASDSPGNFFKSAPAQSGGVDGYSKSESDARYAQKTEIPTALPANGGNADTVGGHTVLTDVPENAVFDLSGYMKKNEPITIGNVFTPFPRQVDTNGKIVYSEYTRKNSDGTADKLFRIMGDPDAPSYSDFQAHYDGQNVIWYFNGTGLGVSAKISGKTVITEATAALQEFGGTPKLSDGVKTDVAVSFNPKIVLLFNSGRIITGGYAIAMGTKKFTVTPSSVSAMGTATPGYIAFG